MTATFPQTAGGPEVDPVASEALILHAVDTTGVHGIADTTALVVGTDPRLAAAAGVSMSLASDEDRRSAAIPAFVRANAGSPVLTAADAVTGGNAGGSIYWPWVFKVPTAVSVPAGQRYRLYYSTDHAVANGHTRVAFGPSPLGPWTDQGEIYRKTGGGNETETPAVVYQPNDPASKPFYMYVQVNAYPGAVGQQSTILLRSADGLTVWENLGTIVDPFSTLNEWGDSDGHTGYFIPFRLGEGFAAYHLHGGGSQPNNPGFAISYSANGREWVTDPRFLKFEVHMLGTNTYRVEWNSCTPFTWRGRLWLAGMYSNGASGAGAKDARIFVAPLAPNLRRLLAPPSLLLPPVAPETANYRAIMLYSEAGTLYLNYQTDDKFFTAVAGA